MTVVVGPSILACASTSRRAKPQCLNRRSFSGNSSRVLSVILRARGALALASQAVISDRAIPRPRASGATETRATWSASPLTLQSAIAMSASPSKTPKPPPAAILAAIDGPVSRRADDGGVVRRLWAAKAVRMSSAALPASAFVRDEGQVGTPLRRHWRLDREFHGPTYKTVARLEGKGGEFPQRSRASWTKFNPCFRPALRRRLVFAALAGEDRLGAVHRAERAMRRTIHDHELDPQGGVESRRGRRAGDTRLPPCSPRLLTISSTPTACRRLAISPCRPTSRTSLM